MAKGYWIARVDVADPEQYQRYVAASTAAFAKYGAVALARGGRSDVALTRDWPREPGFAGAEGILRGTLRKVGVGKWRKVSPGRR